MKKLVLGFVMFFAFISLQANEGFDAKYSRINNTTSQIEFTIGSYDLRPVVLNGTNFTKIVFEGRVYTKDQGFAELPFINANIQLSSDKNVTLQVIEQEYTDFQINAPLVPSRGVIYRNQDPSQIPYTIAPQSIVNAMYPGEIAKTTEPYIIKDVRGTTVFVYPFQYNAATQTVRVFSKVTVQLTENNTAAVNPLYQTSGKVFREMEGIYKSVFMNYESQTDDLTIGEAGDILVITTARDEAAIQPYIDWKMEKGYNVSKEVVATGTNVKTLVQQKYNANNDILYVQLVGDWADIKCDLGGGASAPMDPMLGCVVGTDNFPDIAIGRFSATSAAQVTVQVNKTINYEKNPSSGWYTKAIGVASNQGPGDDNELDYEHINVIYNSKLDPFSYDQLSTAYDPSGTATMVKNYIEAGASIINYCGHGSMTSWGSTGFSNSNIATLTNGDKLPFIFSVACVNGAFHSGECFAEAWLKKENGGAIMTLMATINQSWDPPMRGEDYFNDVLTGGYNYTTGAGNGINTDEGRTIIGSIVVNGLVLMYTESSASDDLETIQTWTTFGDAALQPRTAEPATLSLSSNIMLVGTPFETTITANGAPIEGAMVCLSQNGVYSSAYTDANGNVSITNEFLPGDVKLVVTGFNTQTIYEIIQCIPPTGPYVISDSYTINDAAGNNNGLLDYGEQVLISLGLKNVGVSNATDVTVTISSNDTFVTITDNTEVYGTIEPNQTISIANGFAIEATEDIPDGHNIIFDVSATSGTETWNSNFTIQAHAPALEFDHFVINDSNGNNNGFLDPGETVTMIVSVTNTGSADAYEVVGMLSGADPYVTVSTTQPQPYGNLIPGIFAEASFTVSAAANTPFGYTAQLTIDLSANMGISQQDVIEIVFSDYCEATTSVEDEYIANVQCGDISNASGWQGSVANYTDISTTLQPGTPVPITVTNGNAWASDIVYVWVDWNLNKEFGNANETFQLTNVGGQGQTFTGNITAPAGQNPGTFRMRVRMTYSTAPAPCGDATYGEVEDYTVIVAGVTANFSANVTSGCEGMEVQFTDNSIGATSWLWTFEGGTPATSTDQNPVVVYPAFGLYDVTLEVSNGTNSTSMTKNDYIDVMTVPGQAGPINGPSSVNIGDVEEYSTPALDECTLYNWVLTPAEAGTMVSEMNVATVTWSESYTGSATLKVCGGNDCGMGPYSTEFQIIVYDPTGIYENSGKGIRVYPNPNHGQFQVKLNASEATSYDVIIVNMLGVDVFTKTVEVNGNYTENINLSALPEGVYYLYLKNAETTTVKKVVIQK